MVGGAWVVLEVAAKKTADLAFLKRLMEAGKPRPSIDTRQPLESIVEAHGYGETGHKRGNVVIATHPAT
jgi:hypothetical protein